MAGLDSRRQVTATASSPGSTAMRDSQVVSSSRRRWPQLRISAQLASSPKATKVISSSPPIRLATAPPGQRPQIALRPPGMTPGEQSETFRGLLTAFSGKTFARAEASFQGLNKALKKRAEGS
jgi:hypothetical protein